jgi:molybdopterin synthase catalytic subunit
MIRITEESAIPQQFLNNLETNASGSIVMHVGIVRPNYEDRRVVSIEYEADKSAADLELSEIAKELKTRWTIQDVALYRRIGKLNLGDVILIVGVAAPHRKEAFEACEYAVERMRAMASVKKREVLE